MIPETAGALLAFLGLVAPGLIFELRRERRRPSTEESAFREASRVALTSLLFTVLSLLVVALLRAAWPSGIADFRLWLAEGMRYVVAHYRTVAFTLMLEVAIACILALAADWAIARVKSEQGEISTGGLWFQVLRNDRPRGSTPWLHVRLTDGTTFWGYVRGYTAAEKLADREIALEGVRLTQQDAPPTEAAGEMPRLAIGKDWETVILRGDMIRYIRVQYTDNATGAPTSKRRRLASEAVTDG